MKRINLLPQEERVKASRERGLIWAILILVAVVVVLGLVYVKYNSDVGAKQDELDAIQAETAAVQAQIAELSPYAALQAQRTAMTETAKGIYESVGARSRSCCRSSASSSRRTSVCRRSRRPCRRRCCRGRGCRVAAPAAAARHGRRDVHRSDGEAPRCGRVHDEARPHPAAHGHHADELHGAASTAAGPRRRAAPRR